MFDAHKVSQLKPGERLTFEMFPGLRLESRKTKKTWVFRYRSPLDGSIRQLAIGNWPAVSFSAAISEWERLYNLKAQGLDPVLEKKKEAEHHRILSTTVGDVVDFYLEHHVRQKRTERSQRWTRELFAKLGAFRDVPVASLERKDAVSLILLQAESAPYTAMRLKGELAAAWDFAIDNGLVPEDLPNYWRTILRRTIRSRGKKIQGEHVGTQKRVLSVDELRAVLHWLPSVGSERTRDALYMYLWTGCRGAEIVAIEGREIKKEADGWWWTIPAGKLKEGKKRNVPDHRVPLVGRALEIVQKRMECYGDGYLFPARGGGHMRQKMLSQMLYRYMPYCKHRPAKDYVVCPVSHWSPHDLRRTVRTHLAALGCPDAVAEAILAHAIPGVMGVYNRHAYDKEKREWLTKLSEFLYSLKE
ncbi:site-specific integrase [Candidatus Parcubacteria bacterium]|nr:MAG: site-specific integrase [Candidatus Parcubacteria bacterium]